MITLLKLSFLARLNVWFIQKLKILKLLKQNTLPLLNFGRTLRITPFLSGVYIEHLEKRMSTLQELPFSLEPLYFLRFSKLSNKLHFYPFQTPIFHRSPKYKTSLLTHPASKTLTSFSREACVPEHQLIKVRSGRRPVKILRMPDLFLSLFLLNPPTKGFHFATFLTRPRSNIVKMVPISLNPRLILQMRVERLRSHGVISGSNLNRKSFLLSSTSAKNSYRIRS